MKRTNNKYLLVGMIITIVMASCSKIGDINYSPNNPKEPQTGLLITNAQRQSIPGLIGSITPRHYVQYTADVIYTQGSRYFDKLFDYSATYSGPLADLNLIIKLNTDDATKSLPNVIGPGGGGTNANQIASSRVLRAFIFLNWTDRWGDIPYSEALKGIEDLSPKFDLQKDIYNDIFKELTEAVAQFDAAGTLKGDILLGNSIPKWKKFANTIKLVAALHLSKIDAALGKAKFNEALAAGVITSNADNIKYAYLLESANENPIYNNYEVAKRYDYAVSKYFVDTLISSADPRLPIYADKNSAGIYAGMPYGLAAGTGYNSGTIAAPGNVSLIGSKFRVQNAPTDIYNYAGVLFAVAEASKLGWITGTPDDVAAKTAYDAGIAASMSQHGIAGAAATAYAAQPSIVYNPAKAIAQIIYQKYVANFMAYSYETWADWRRTNFPALVPAPAAYTSPKEIPRRQAYNAQEASLNTDNYNTVVARQGPDELLTRIWWDKP
jgi:hypothetical protein